MFRRWPLIVSTVVALIGTLASVSVQAATTAPVCPSGFTFSHTQGMCISTAAPTCNRPNSWDPEHKGCYTIVAATCPSGYVFERGGTLCRPSNMTTATSTASVAPSCPSGYSLSGRSCRSITAGPPVCQSGYRYNASLALCQRSSRASCPSGYRFDVMHKVCVTGIVPQ